MSLKERSILFAPAHYITGHDVGGSELQWAFDIVSQAAARFGTVDAVLCDLRNGSFPDNVRVHAVDPGRHVNYLEPKEGALFVARYVRAALRVCRASPPSILHHAFPWGARTFNPLILGRGTPLGPSRATRIVMGPLQRPMFGISTLAEEGVRFGLGAQAARADSSTKQGLSFGILEGPLHGLCRATLRRADAIIALDKAAKSYIEGLGVRAPVSIIPAGVRLEAFVPVDRRSRSGPLRIVCVAYLIKRKNIDLVLRALATVRARGRDVILTLGGDGPERTALAALASELHISAAVRWLGHVANTQIPDVYADADVFVTMSSVESLPAAVVEAMASGLPVISTRTEGALTLVQDGITGALVPFGDPEALATRIEQYVDEPGMRARQGSAARRRVEEEYSWTAIGDAYAALYESLL